MAQHMAIRKLLDPHRAQLSTFEFDNGDYRVLDAIREKWKFKDDESLLRFALAVLLTAEEGFVTVKDEAGKEVFLTPTSDLLQK